MKSLCVLLLCILAACCDENKSSEIDLLKLKLTNGNFKLWDLRSSSMILGTPDDFYNSTRKVYFSKSGSVLCFKFNSEEEWIPISADCGFIPPEETWRIFHKDTLYWQGANFILQLSDDTVKIINKEKDTTILVKSNDQSLPEFLYNKTR